MLIGLSIIALKLYILRHNEKSLTFYSSENIYSSPQFMAHKNNVCSPPEGVASIFSDFSANEKFHPTRPVHPAAAARSVPLSLLAYFSNVLLGTLQKIWQ